MSQASQTQALEPIEEENEVTNYERERRFEQHAHKPLFGRTQSAIAEHLQEAETGCKREFIEPARTVEEQCTAIIGKIPWPFSVCWLCGFPVGEQKGNDDTMLQSIASLMRIKCVFVNPLSKRWDKQTCEHVNPINVAGSGFLNKAIYEGLDDVLNIRMEYEGAHDLCNILKNEGYMITLDKNGEVTLSFKGLKVATWQINSWPAFLLEGSMNGPSLSSVICFVRKNAREEIQRVFLKSPIHGYLFLKVLEEIDYNQWDDIFTALQPQDELATVIISANDIQITQPLAAQIPDKIPKTVAGYFKWYDMSREKTRKTPFPPVSFIHTISTIASIGNAAFQTSVIGIVDTWKEAIKKAMKVRMQKYVNYIKKVDELVDDLLWPLMKSSTQQRVAKYRGNELNYQQLSTLLQQKLIKLKTDTPSEYDRIAVLVLTKKQRNNAHARLLNAWKIDEATNAGLSGTKPRLTQREKSPQPVPGLPVITSLAEYTEPNIFKFKALQKEKATEIALKAVAGVLYNDDFKRKLEHIVATGSFETDLNLTAEADKLIKRAESQCIPDEIYQSQRRSQQRSHSRSRSRNRNRNRTRRHNRGRSGSRSPGRSPRHTRRRSHIRSLSRSLSQPRRSLSSSGGYTRRLKK